MLEPKLYDTMPREGHKKTRQRCYSLQIYAIKVPPAGMYAGKVPVQKCKTAHVVLLLPTIGRSLPQGLKAMHGVHHVMQRGVEELLGRFPGPDPG